MSISRAAQVDGCGPASYYTGGYKTMGSALQVSGRDIVYSCSWPAYIGSNESEKPFQTFIDDGCHLWRNWDDIQCSWESLSSIIDHWGEWGKVLQPWAGPDGPYGGHWHDMVSLATLATLAAHAAHAARSRARLLGATIRSSARRHRPLTPPRVSRRSHCERVTLRCRLLPGHAAHWRDAGRLAEPWRSRRPAMRLSR
jgi:hypothetical protein